MAQRLSPTSTDIARGYKSTDPHLSLPLSLSHTHTEGSSLEK